MVVVVVVVVMLYCLALLPLHEPTGCSSWCSLSQSVLILHRAIFSGFIRIIIFIAPCEAVFKATCLLSPIWKSLI